MQFVTLVREPNSSIKAYIIDCFLADVFGNIKPTVEDEAQKPGEKPVQKLRLIVTLCKNPNLLTQP